MPKIALVLETLGLRAPHSESVVQLLLYAASLKAESCAEGGLQISLIAADGDVAGSQTVLRRFPSLSSAEVAFEPLPEPPVSAVGLAEHQRIYAVFEALKSAPYSQIHFADLGGLGHYLTLGKKSGLFFANTQLVVHVLGSSLFCRDAQEALVNSEALLMTDVFECTSVENFDHVLVHDRKAWTWYGNRLSSLPKAVDDISWGAADRVKQALATAPSVRNSPQKGLRIVYLGTLGPEAGLRFFCELRFPSHKRRARSD